MTGKKPVVRMQQILMWKAGRGQTVTVLDVTPANSIQRHIGPQWAWVRRSANHVDVAQSPRSYPERRHAVRAARVEAELTGARLVIEEAS